MKKLLEFLNRKGVICTVFGVLLGLAIDIKVAIAFYKNIEMSKAVLWTVIVLNILAIVWVMLPSKIKFISKLLTIEIDD